MDAEAYFNGLGQSILIQCKSDEKMSSIFQSFAKKIKYDVSSFEFLFRKNKIDNNSTIKSLKNDKATDIDIEVVKRSQIMKCPLCICNNAIIKIEDYKLNYYGCCHHDEAFNKRFDDYEKDQTIVLKNISCDGGCHKTQEDDLKDFNKCLQCSKDFRKAKYFCYDCSNNHRKDHTLIKYNEKYYYCTKHIQKKNLFSSYCYDCNDNLCKECEREKKHKSHKVVTFDKLVKDIEPIKKNLGDIEIKILDLKDIIADIVNSMNQALKVYQNYCAITYDIIRKYEEFNKDTKFKNYQVLETINLLEQSTKKIFEDLKEFKDKRLSLKDKCAKLIEIDQKDKSAFAKIKVNPIHGKQENYSNNNDDNEEIERPNPPPTYHYNDKKTNGSKEHK